MQNKRNPGNVKTVFVMPGGASGEGGRKKPEVSIWQKSMLTLEEAAAYSGVGINKIQEITNRKECKFVLFVGTRRLIKRRLFDEYLENTYAI